MLYPILYKIYKEQGADYDKFLDELGGFIMTAVKYPCDKGAICEPYCQAGITCSEAMGHALFEIFRAMELEEENNGS